MVENDSLQNALELRKHAEEKLKETHATANTALLSVEEANAVIHDLHLHQIELELQNEELRTTQIALETSHAKYIDLYDFSPVGLFTLDDADCIKEANLTIASMLGIDRAKLINRNLTDFIDSSAQDVFHFFYQKLRNARQPAQCEIVLLSTNHNPFPVRLDGTVLMLSGLQKLYRISVTDMTLQKEADSVRMAFENERQRIKVLTEFVRDISHDLRTPITISIASLETLRMLSTSEKQTGKIETIINYLFYLNQVLDQLQQMAVLDNTTEFVLQSISLNKLVAQVIDGLTSKAEAKQLKLTTDLHRGLPEILLNVDQMNQVLKNLIENAFQFTRPDGKISVKTYQEDQHIVIEVRDNGIGINAQTIPHIFERFFKADSSRHLDTGGAGLGLPIAKRIIELHHGTIDVESIPDVSTVFRIKLNIPSKPDN